MYVHNSCWAAVAVASSLSIVGPFKNYVTRTGGGGYGRVWHVVTREGVVQTLRHTVEFSTHAHKRVPSVYAGIEIKPNDIGNRQAVSNYGSTYIYCHKIWEHSSSTAFYWHWQQTDFHCFGAIRRCIRGGWVSVTDVIFKGVVEGVTLCDRGGKGSKSPVKKCDVLLNPPVLLLLLPLLLLQMWYCTIGADFMGPEGLEPPQYFGPGLIQPTSPPPIIRMQNSNQW